MTKIIKDKIEDRYSIGTNCIHASRRAAEYGYSLAIDEIEKYKALLRFAGVPEILIDNPSLLFGKPTPEDIEWVKNKINQF